MELDKLARRPKLSQPFSAARRSHTTHHVEIGSTAAFDTRGPPRPLTRLLADHRRDQQQDAIGMHRPFVLLSLKCPAFSWSFALVLVLVLTAYTTHSCCWQVLAYICFNRLLIRWHRRLRILSRYVRLSLLFDGAFVINLSVRETRTSSCLVYLFAFATRASSSMGYSGCFRPVHPRAQRLTMLHAGIEPG